MARGDKGNEYADAIGLIFNDTPKTVLAAIAVSALTIGGDQLDKAVERVVREWLTLYANGIVPQRPPAKVRDLDRGEV